MAQPHHRSATPSERDTIIEGLLVAPERGLLARDLMPGRDPRAAGAILRAMRSDGLAERLGSGNTGRWRPTPRLVAAVRRAKLERAARRLARAAEAVAAPAAIALPPPPGPTDPARLERLTFPELARLLGHFVGAVWFVKAGPLYLHATAEYAERSRWNDDEEVEVSLEQGGVTVFFSRRRLRRATMDRHFNELTVVDERDGEITIEFAPDLGD